MSGNRSQPLSTSTPVTFQVTTVILLIAFSLLVQWLRITRPITSISPAFGSYSSKLSNSQSLIEARINASLSIDRFKWIHRHLLVNVSEESHIQFRQLLLSIIFSRASTPSPRGGEGGGGGRGGGNLSLEQSMKLIQNWIGSKRASSTFYPEPNDEYFRILDSIIDAKIMKMDVVSKGSQLKLLLTLEGNVKAIFKPKRYDIDHIITGGPVAGFDRHNSEIVSFHISRLLDMRRAPFTTGRKLGTEVFKVATGRLKKTFTSPSCFYGRCFYCYPKETVCADRNGFIEGALILMLPDDYNISSRPNPTRKLNLGSKVRETEEHFCKNLGGMSEKSWLDLVDVSIFDFLIQNSDRHHLEVNNAGEILLIDAGKGFGNPFRLELPILYPLIHCCVFKKSTLDRLVLLHHSGFKEILEIMMKKDPLYPLLSHHHLKSLQLRLKIIQVVMHECMDKFAGGK